jgi:predicted class III extradiol MEMO1 family dioxygenase
MLGLVDARQVSEKMLVVPPAAQMVMPLLDGNNSLDDIVSKVGRGLTPDILRDMVVQLDEAALLFGPNFDALMARTQEEFDAADTLPPASTAQFTESIARQSLGDGATEEQIEAEGARKLREFFDQWMAKSLENVAKPSFDSLPKAVVTPHLDYGRGWMNYAHVYGRLRVCDRPARVVILGTNHFGFGTGVVGCNKGFTTALGTCNADTQLVSILQKSLGNSLFEHRTDHEREHSIELQVPWIQHVFGKDERGEYPRVFGALVHDPAVNNGASYDGSGVDIESFVKALKAAMRELPGPTLIIASADLSHVGPAFGDKQALSGESEEVVKFRNSVIQHDSTCLQMILQNKPSDLIGAMAWQQNPTRWCSTGNLVATLMLVEPSKVEMLNYGLSMDQQGTTLVSSTAMAMF